LASKLEDLSLSARLHQRYRIIEEVRKATALWRRPTGWAATSPSHDVALSSPLERGLPFSTWSVAKLAEHCRAKRLLPEVTDEWVRRLLRREGLSAQRIRTWKTSHDPHFDGKKNASGCSTGEGQRGPR